MAEPANNGCGLDGPTNLAQFSDRSRTALRQGEQDMSTREQFAEQLHSLIEKFAHGEVDPIDLANELQDQVNVFIGQHNLEYELCRPLQS
jgi:hypothetical protein